MRKASTSNSRRLCPPALRLGPTTPRPPSLHGRLLSSTSTTQLALSEVEGPSHPPLVTKTLPAYFRDDILRPHGARPALVARGERARPHGGPPPRLGGEGTRDGCLRWDFGELDAHVRALARGLVGLGVGKGDRVGVIMGNNSAYACLQWACASIGAVLVTLNPAYRIPELASTLNLVGVTHLFVVPRLRSSAYVRALCAAFPALANSPPGGIQEEALPALRHLIVVDNLSSALFGSGSAREGARALERELEGARPAVDFREVMVWREDAREGRVVRELEAGLRADEVINLQFTSGTTGAPKAVSLTHHNLLNNALAIARCMRLTEADVLWNLAAWSHGACIVYPSEAYDPVVIVDAVTEERCTALHGVPTHFLGVLAEVQRRREEGKDVDTSNLRTGIAAGSPVPIDLMKQLIEKLNLTELTVAYGMTETSPVTFQSTPADPIVKRVETVGKVLPHVRAKLVDPAGRVVPVGTPGELLVAGYPLQKGYWEDAAHTREVMRADAEGMVWMHTGDEGVMDAEGYLRIVGRIKDIIIRGGENLFPVQIENALTAHPAVREAAAVAVPDTAYGEVVGAWVVREPHAGALSREDVRRAVSQGMNPQNAPAWVWFAGEDGAAGELPKTASGKVQKHILRAWSKELAAKGVGRVGSSDGRR